MAHFPEFPHFRSNVIYAFNCKNPHTSEGQFFWNLTPHFVFFPCSEFRVISLGSIDGVEFVNDSSCVERKNFVAFMSSCYYRENCQFSSGLRLFIFKGDGEFFLDDYCYERKDTSDVIIDRMKISEELPKLGLDRDDLSHLRDKGSKLLDSYLESAFDLRSPSNGAVCIKCGEFNEYAPSSGSDYVCGSCRSYLRMWG